MEGLVISQTSYRYGVSEDWHSHENAHFSLILEGGNKEVRKKQEIDAVPGTLLAYRRNEMHRNLHTQHPSRNINLEIESAFLLRYDLGEQCLYTMEYQDVQLAMLKIYKECLLTRNPVSAAHSLLLAATGGKPVFPQKTPPPQWVSKLQQLLHDRWSETLSLQELSGEAGVHPVTISRYFPVYFGTTLGGYHRKIRLARSLQLVKSGEYSLSQIAQRCGFFDQSHFIHNFRKFTGFLPKEFRKL